jgi:hypothetical protein
VVGSTAPGLGHPVQTNRLLVSMIDAGDVRMNIAQWTMATATALPENAANEIATNWVKRP